MSKEYLIGTGGWASIDRKDLIRRQGWKLFDVTEAGRIRVGEYLRGLPERTYNDLKEVTDNLTPLTR